MLIEAECAFCGHGDHNIAQCPRHAEHLIAMDDFEAMVARREAALNSLPVAVANWLMASH